MSSRKLISCDPEKCTNCGVCEYICSFEKEGSFNRFKSRITVVHPNPLVSTSTSCKLCIDAPCVAACPQKALEQNQETGIVHVDEEKCTACGWCIKACEYGALQLVSGRHPEKNVVVVCDLCEGRNGGPACVEFCPEDALELIEQGTKPQKIRIASLRKSQKIEKQSRSVTIPA